MDQNLQGSFTGLGHDLRSHNNMVSYRLNNINKIFRNLEKSNKKHKATSHTDTTILQENVNALMSKVSDDSNDLSKGLGSIVDTFDSNRHDTDDLESILENEQQRSKNILQLAAYLDNQVNKIYSGVNSIFNQVEKERLLPKGFQDSVNSKFNVVQETIDSLTKVASSSPRDIDNVMNKAEQNIALANEESKAIEEYKPLSAILEHPVLPETVATSEADDYDEPSSWNPTTRRGTGEVTAVISTPTMFDAECQTEAIIEPESPTSNQAADDPSSHDELG